MTRDTIQTLKAITTEFYSTQAESFSNTRHSAWNGFESLSDFLSSSTPLSILDLAAGNLRFERWLAQKLPSSQLNIYAVDATADLIKSSPWNFPDTVTIHPIVVDIIEYLLEIQDSSPHAADCQAYENSLLSTLPCKATNTPQRFDMVCSFGFMHHVPSFELRSSLLQLMVNSLTTGGIAVVSFWQFMKSERRATKVKEVHERALATYKGRLNADDLEPGDWFLGWQHSNSYRYCHHFEDSEIDRLIQTVAPNTKLIKRYYADGKDVPLNCYIVLQKL